MIISITDEITMKMLISQLELRSLGKTLLARIVIISLQVNVKTPFHLLSSYCKAKSSINSNPKQILKVGGGGFVMVALPPAPSGYGPGSAFVIG